MQKAKRYSSIKYSLEIFGTIYLVGLLIIFLAFGFSQRFSEIIRAINPRQYFVLPAYLLGIFLIYSLLNFPLIFYRSYVIEHRFSLSTQNIKDWFLDQFKTGIIGYIIVLILLGAFYYIVQHAPVTWWLIVSIFWIFFSVILARITPVLIIPLFFKYKKMTDSSLKGRILALAEKMKVKILDVFEIDFSSKTLKANAAFVGIGKTRRVILADTLKDKYTDEEIEVILAHELAHYKYRHLLKMLLLNFCATAICLYLVYKTAGFSLAFFALRSLGDVASLPLVILYFVISGIILQPLENYLSRIMEKNADILALKTVGNKNAFITMMEKLASQNLADRTPHPLIKFFFFDHPPVDERIKLAEV